MDIGSILLGLALLAGVAFLVARPLLEQRRAPARKAHNGREALLAEQELLLNALRDLDFDHTTGKVSAEDYAPQRADLLARGVAVLQQLDALGAAPANGRAARSVDDEIEALVAARRSGRGGRSAGVACPRCGAGLADGDRFCAGCGAAVTACPACGRPGLAEDRFCAGCGEPLKALDETPA